MRGRANFHKIAPIVAATITYDREDVCPALPALVVIPDHPAPADPDPISRVHTDPLLYRTHFSA